MTVEVRREGRVLIVSMQREAKRNALNADITAGIDAAMNELEDDPELWVGILTGTASVFSAGADLSAGPGDPTPRGGLVGLIGRERTKPLIAAVEGFAVGGGLELVLSCDLVVASATAKFGLPEPRRGLMADFGGVFRSVAVLPANVARELILTGDHLDAERAERLGFVNVLTEAGGALAGALGLAGRICANAPLPVREGLAIANHVIRGAEDDLWARSHAAHQRLLASDDVREGLDAFFTKREPEWRGR